MKKGFFRNLFPHFSFKKMILNFVAYRDTPCKKTPPLGAPVQILYIACMCPKYAVAVVVHVYVELTILFSLSPISSSLIAVLVRIRC